MAVSMQTTDIILIGKVPAAVGLTWMPLLGGDMPTPKVETVDLLRQEKLRYATIYLSDVPNAIPMAGLVGRDPPKKITSAMPVATWLAEVVERPTVYIEAVKNKTGSYWVLAAWPGKIHQGTDQIQSDTNASRLLEQILGDMETSGQTVDLFYGGDGAYPGSNVVERFKPRRSSLAEILRQSPPSTLPKIKQMTGVTPGVVFGVIAFLTLIIMSVAGYFAWQAYEQRKAAEAMLAEQMMTQGAGADLQALSDARVREAVNAALKEDTATLSPGEVIRACVASLQQFPKIIGGWQLMKVSCGGQRAEASYNLASSKPNGANAESFVAQATALGFVPSVGFGVESAVLSLDIAGVTIRPSLTLETLPRMSEAAVVLPSRFQMMRGIVRGTDGRFDPPVTRDAQFEDPIQTLAQKGAPVMAPVPEASSYKKGNFSMAGQGLGGLYRLDWEDPWFTVERIEVSLATTGGYTFILSGHYVVANGG